ncbi:MAG: NgoFVII family restriction endonuclease [Candidatus Kapabacteria bacterium]|nr:NgoFVII family restriction endonuclease [Candidatus Kapabacteria bacterium]
MLSKNLFDEVLIQPAHNGANKLYIVSGYATSAMAFHHLQYLRKNDYQVSVELIVGMCVADGLSESNHKGFQKLVQNDFLGTFSCSYLTEMPPVHSKVYSWYKNEQPICSFIGSANYSQKAFGKNQREVMTVADAEQGLNYFQGLIPQSIYCDHIDTESIVQIYNEKSYERVRRERTATQQLQAEIETMPSSPISLGLPSVQVNLLDRYGNLPQRSGLNWGQRPEYRREPNQAYIKLPSSIYNTDFFPQRGVHFTVLTDDDKVLICTRAQDNAKAIETPHNNSLIGEYFRNRLGLPNGALVTTDNLIRYGRTTVDFYKIDDETYFMDFSAPRN